MATGMSGNGSCAALLAADEGRVLLRLARQSLQEHFGAGGRDDPGRPPLVIPESLLGPRGVFVTLTRRGELRGCTGYMSGVRPLAQAVIDLAISSAARDSRFEPVAASELDELKIEISVLTPLAPIAAEEVEVGRHGLVVRLDGRSGLLLPQVPLDWGWDRTAFLEGTCRKAGLPRDAWQRPGVELLGFEAQIFEEEPAGAGTAPDPRAGR